MGLSDGLAWTARSGELKRKKVLIHVLDSISSTVLDMRGSTPLSRSKLINMTKKRTMNEIRQTKEYYTGNNDYEQWASKANNSEKMKENIENMKECPLDPIEEAKILIVDKITKHFSDFLFEMVNNEMGKNHVFQSQNYLTEAGYEQFEDEWFEFYHDHHGDIIYEVMNNVAN